MLPSCIVTLDFMGKDDTAVGGAPQDSRNSFALAVKSYSPPPYSLFDVVESSLFRRRLGCLDEEFGTPDVV